MNHSAAVDTLSPSLLIARGIPSPIIVLTLLFVFAVAMPIVFMLTTAAVGLSDVWLDYRRLEPTPDVLAWLRNLPRKPWAFRLPCTYDGEDHTMFPDFLFLRR